MKGVNLNYANIQGLRLYSTELRDTTFLGAEPIEISFGISFNTIIDNKE